MVGVEGWGVEPGAVVGSLSALVLQDLDVVDDFFDNELVGNVV